MENEILTRATEHRYGPVSFVSALVGTFAMEFVAWVSAIPYVIITIIYVLPALLVVDLAVYALLAKRPGALGQVGRGILIGSLSVPVSLIVFTAGFVVAHAIGPI
jgi:hypothetical protein